MLTHKTAVQFFRNFSNFIPKHNPISSRDKDIFLNFLREYDNILVLSGAGISTESGIPDYRSVEVGMFCRTSYKPIQFDEFVKSSYARQRYWSRNYVAWPKFCTLSPNKAHHDVHKYQCFRKISGVVTQNVDGLHTKAGSTNVVELHGNGFWVGCLDCRFCISRFDFQETLRELNPKFCLTPGDIRPDGDTEVSEDEVRSFVVPECTRCGGIMKPTIVFFGEDVPKKRVNKVEQLVEECDALLVLGTTLSTLSSYRICTQAYDLCKFICIVNIGPTKGNNLADLIINGKCSEIFPGDCNTLI